VAKKKHIIPSVIRRGTVVPAAPTGARDILQEGVRLLRRGNYDEALQQVARARELHLDAAWETAARELAAEAHFRAAMQSDSPSNRLSRLEAAIAETPDAPKLHFHRGVALLQMGRFNDAFSELDLVAQRQPARRGLAYLYALASIAVGRPWSPNGMLPAELNTVRLVEKLVYSNGRSGPITFEGPLLGKGVEMWQALIAMRTDAAAAPTRELKVAAEQNMRRPIARILRYYQGVAALRQDDRETARSAWTYVQGAGMTSAALEENLTALLRGEVIELAQAGRWQEVAQRADRLANSNQDRILAETVALAHYHLGYEAARAGKWSSAVQHWRKASEWAPSRHIAQNLALAEEALGNWVAAAEAWREMARRRPRKEDHPDYLTDAQVAAIWAHAADCYAQAGRFDEVEPCLRNALKYAPNDAALRLRLADFLLDAGRQEAAEGQLKEIVAIEPQNVEALVRLGRLYEERWDRDPMPIWRQVLAADPTHAEARDALAEGYINMTTKRSILAPIHLATLRPTASDIEVLEAGLKELPGHPKLLVALGSVLADVGRDKEARENLLQAYRAAPQNVEVVSQVLHDLLHAQAGDVVEKLIPEVRQIPHLLPAFWFSQATQSLNCEFGEEWAFAFIEEALELGKQPWVEDTRAGLLLEAYHIARQGRAPGLSAELERRIRAEVPLSGAVQYLEAAKLYYDKKSKREAAKLLQEAIRMAQKAHDNGVLRYTERLDMEMKGLLTDFDLQRALLELLGGKL